MIKFTKDKYVVIKKALDKETAILAYNYLLVKRQVHKTLLNRRDISPFDQSLGTFNDAQVPGSWSCYGDILMETLLMKLKPILEKHTKKTLIETYSYCRVYVTGNELKRHIDRPSCEISATLNLGGDMWPIYLKNIKGVSKKVKLNLGDLLIYSGSDLEHWRDPFEKEMCGQVFFHYNDINGTHGEQNRYDTRPHLGLPDFTKKQAKFTRHGK
jgi:hypothetical protein